MSDQPVLNRPAPQALDLLLSRRSGSAKRMTGPGPDTAQLRTILAAGARVPDHGKLAPWRFIIFEGDARVKFGEILVERLKQTEPEASEERVSLEARRLLRAPLVIAVVSRARGNAKVPEWEQVLSAGAVCENMLLAATALGFVANWITEWHAYDPVVRERLGLVADERIAGFLYFGTSTEPLEERTRPDLDALITRF